jgi:hypothetical protein
LAARGFEQVDGIHYDESDKAAPVINDITVRIILVLIKLECDDQGELKEYVGCKVDYDKEKRRMKFT